MVCSLFLLGFSLFFHGVSWFFQRTGFQRTGYPLIFIDGYPSMNIIEFIDGYPLMNIKEFIDGCPSMNINGYPSMIWFPFLWAPSLGHMIPSLGHKYPFAGYKDVGTISRGVPARRKGGKEKNVPFLVNLGFLGFSQKLFFSVF